MDGRLPFRFHNGTGPAINSVVELGDRNISSNVSRVQFDAAVGDICHVVLTMPLIRGATLDLAGAIVDLSTETKEILLSLGWTPPAPPSDND